MTVICTAQINKSSTTAHKRDTAQKTKIIITLIIISDKLQNFLGSKFHECEGSTKKHTIASTLIGAHGGVVVKALQYTG